MARKPPYSFRPNEEQAFLKACEDDPRNHAIFKTFFGSGMAVSELVGDKRYGYRGLYVEDIDLTSSDESTFRVRVLSKGKKKRFVLVTKQAIEEILRYLGDRRTGKIFDITPRMVQKLARKYSKKAGLPDFFRCRKCGQRQIPENMKACPKCGNTKLTLESRWSPHKARHTLREKIIRKTNDYLVAAKLTGKQPPRDIPFPRLSEKRKRAVMKEVFEER